MSGAGGGTGLSAGGVRVGGVGGPEPGAVRGGGGPAAGGVLVDGPRVDGPEAGAVKVVRAAVRFDDVCVRYPKRAEPVLSGVSLALAAGRSCLVVGPSGCGKSTLLRLLTGLIPQTIHAEVSGGLEVMAADPREVATVHLAARVGYLQQNPLDQLCLATVAEDVAFTLENRGVPVEQIDARVHAALAQVGAGHLASRSVATLSGGEAQRVALAGVLVSAPSLLLLDEPTAMLDPVGAAHVGEAIGSLIASGGRGSGLQGAGLEGAGRQVAGQPGADRVGADRRTLLLIEHRLDELPALPQDTLVIDGAGQVVAYGPTDQVLAAHARKIEELGCWLPLDVRLASYADPVEGLAAEYLPGARRPQPVGIGARAQTPAATAATVPLLRARGVTVPIATAAVGAGRTVGAVGAVGAGGAAVAAGATAPERAVVEDIDLDLYPGTVTAIVGVNGAGKSTLLRALAGLCPAEGSLEWSGHCPTEQRIGMVFQHPEHQFLHRSVREEIAHGSPGTTPQDLDHLLATFGLTHVAGADPFRLSGGQQRRLSLAAAFATSDPVLLLDEPTFAQDRANAARIAIEIRAMAAAGRAIVLVTHDLALAAELADQVLLLRDGRAVARGAPGLVLAPEVVARHGLALPELLARRRTAGLSVEGWPLGPQPDEQVREVGARGCVVGQENMLDAVGVTP